MSLRSGLIIIFLLFVNCGGPFKTPIKVIEAHFNARNQRDQKLMARTFVKFWGRFHFWGNKTRWKVIYEEDLLESERNSGRHLMVTESITDNHPPLITSFYLIKTPEGWKIEGYFAHSEGPPEGANFPIIEDVRGLASGCSQGDLAEIYLKLLKMIQDKDLSGLKTLLARIGHDSIAYLVLPFTGPLGQTGERLTKKEFIGELLRKDSLLNDFTFVTNRYRMRFSEEPYQRYYDFHRKTFLKVNLRKTANSIQDWIPMMRDSIIKVTHSGFEQSDIKLSESNYFPEEVLAPPLFVCTSDGWKMTHFFAKW